MKDVKSQAHDSIEMGVFEIVELSLDQPKLVAMTFVEIADEDDIEEDMVEIDNVR